MSDDSPARSTDSPSRGVRERKPKRPKNEEVEIDDQKAAKRSRTLSTFFLLLFLIPAALPFMLQAWTMFAESNAGIYLGLFKTPEMRLVDFYKEHNPAKLKQKNFVKGTLRKWRGNEEKLFEILAMKYSKEEKKQAYED